MPEESQITSIRPRDSCVCVYMSEVYLELTLLSVKLKSISQTEQSQTIVFRQHK